MKKEYIAPAIRIIPIEPVCLLAASGSYTTENGPGYGGSTNEFGEDEEFETLAKGGAWDDGFDE